MLLLIKYVNINRCLMMPNLMFSLDVAPWDFVNITLFRGERR